ncbi:MAG: hypothetical protein KUG83_05260 [Gammaproteobacteria bacterium]|nr:hypothetical protein [Gammaproteobacteria bacterium]
MSKPVTIEKFLVILSELHDELDNAYWEANSADHKDVMYNIIDIIRIEAAELNKLSIQDHHYPYEPITQEVRGLKEKLKFLHKNMGKFVPRSKTAHNLEQLIPKVAAQDI